MYERCTTTGFPADRKSRGVLKNSSILGNFVAGVTGLEPATSGVTGQRSNQLSYTPNEAGTMYLPASLSVKPGVLGYQRVKGLFSNNWP